MLRTATVASEEVDMPRPAHLPEEGGEVLFWRGHCAPVHQGGRALFGYEDGRISLADSFSSSEVSSRSWRIDSFAQSPLKFGTDVFPQGFCSSDVSANLSFKFALTLACLPDARAEPLEEEPMKVWFPQTWRTMFLSAQQRKRTTRNGRRGRATSSPLNK